MFNGMVMRFPASFHEAAPNCGSTTDVLTGEGVESKEAGTWMSCCEEMAGERWGEWTLGVFWIIILIRCSVIGEQSPHVGYHLTVNYMINAQESRGEGKGTLYSEQVAVHALKEMTSSCGSGLTPTHKGPNRLSSGIPHLTWLSFFQEAPSVGWIIKSVQQVYKAVCNFTSVLTTTNKQEGYQGANNLTWLPCNCFPCFRINVFMCTAAAVILLKTNPHPLFYSMSCSHSIYLSHSRHLL